MDHKPPKSLFAKMGPTLSTLSVLSLDDVVVEVETVCGVIHSSSVLGVVFRERGNSKFNIFSSRRVLV